MNLSFSSQSLKIIPSAIKKESGAVKTTADKKQHKCSSHMSQRLIPRIFRNIYYRLVWIKLNSWQRNTAYHKKNIMPTVKHGSGSFRVMALLPQDLDDVEPRTLLSTTKFLRTMFVSWSSSSLGLDMNDSKKLKWWFWSDLIKVLPDQTDMLWYDLKHIYYS